MALKRTLFTGMVLATLAAAPIAAATFTVDIAGRCVAECGAAGLATAELKGSVVLDVDAFAPGEVTADGIRSYSFDVGGISVSSDDEVFAANSVWWGDLERPVNGLYIYGFGSGDPAASGPHYAIYAERSPGDLVSHIAPDGFWEVDSTGAFVSFSEGTKAFLAIDPIDAAPIPLPAGVWLLMGSLGALAAVGRARRRTAAAR